MKELFLFFTTLLTTFGIGWLLFTILFCFILFFIYAFFFGVPFLKIEPYKTFTNFSKVIYADEKNKKDKIGYIIPLVNMCHIYGKNWNTKDHQKFYDKLEVECKALGIVNFNVIDANITSKLITKIENICKTNGIVTIKCLPEQKGMLNYLVKTKLVTLDVMED